MNLIWDRRAEWARDLWGESVTFFHFHFFKIAVPSLSDLFPVLWTLRRKRRRRKHLKNFTCELRSRRRMKSLLPPNWDQILRNLIRLNLRQSLFPEVLLLRLNRTRLSRSVSRKKIEIRLKSLLSLRVSLYRYLWIQLVPVYHRWRIPASSCWVLPGQRGRTNPWQLTRQTKTQTLSQMRSNI